MATKDLSKHEPLIHITKRDALPWQKTLLIRAIAILSALLFTALVITLLT